MTGRQIALQVRVSQRAYSGMLAADYLADTMPDEKARLWEKRLSQSSDPERLRVTLAHFDNELAGFSFFLFDQETQFGTYLHNLYVDPRLSGERCRSQPAGGGYSAVFTATKKRACTPADSGRQSSGAPVLREIKCPDH